MAADDQTDEARRSVESASSAADGGHARSHTSVLNAAVAFVEQIRSEAQKAADAYERWAAGPQGRAMADALNEVHRRARTAEGPVNEWADRVRTWANSPQGQNVLDGLDVLLVAREVGDFYERAGIYRPLDARFMRDVLEQIDANVPHDLRRTIDSVAPGSDAWGWIREGLEPSPSLARWRPQLVEALDCMEDARWHASVSTLLPIIEGVVADKSGVLERMRVGRRLEQLLSADHDGTPGRLIVAMVTYPALKVIDAEIFANRDFATTAPNDPVLNRHTILHGVTGGYGSRENAVRSLMVVAALAELFDGPVALRAPSHHRSDATLMEDFGPIARMRRPRAQSPERLDASAPRRRDLAQRRDSPGDG